MDPLTILAMGGSSILEAIINKLLNQQSKDVRGLTKDVARKGRQLLANPGFDESTLQAIFGKNFENVRAQGKNVRESTTGTLARAGMLGTGTETKAAQENAWSNENLVTEAMRDLLVTGEAKKSSDIALATQMLGASSGAAQSQGGQGPALTEMLLSAILMGKMGKKSAIGEEPAEIMRNLFGDFSFSTPGQGPGGGLVPANWLTSGAKSW